MDSDKFKPHEPEKDDTPKGFPMLGDVKNPPFITEDGCIGRGVMLGFIFIQKFAKMTMRVSQMFVFTAILGITFTLL